MGLLIGGKWQRDDAVGADVQGRFIRSESTFRRQISADGSTGFKAEPGRYHLYVALSCPWAHRTLIMRKLKGLEDAVSLSVVDSMAGAEGWRFSTSPGTIPDTVYGAEFLWQVYVKAQPDYTGRVTVPVLWDKRTNSLVNNESREILRMFDVEFDAFAKNPTSYAPEDLRVQADELITANYVPINNGVYRAGFAKSQAAHEESVRGLFAALDRCEATLARRRYLCGDRITEADWCLFTTLVRFDSVYYTLFKCNLRRIVDYPNLWNYTKELYQVPGVAETTDFRHIKEGYFGGMTFLNPSGIVPLGPLLDFRTSHDRARRLYAA